MTQLTAHERGTSSALGRESFVPLLSDEQAGHIRHIDNLSRLQRGDWRHMMGPLPMQEDFSSYRYQLGFMGLATALAHYHRLPAAPSVFQGTLDRLIQKMLEPDAWLYWRDTSTAGGYHPFDLPRLPSRTDPVAVDNIMYSAYLQVMTLMYTMLFGDRKYEEPGSLSFSLRPILWGKDRRESFQYDQKSLNERIYWNMVESGYLGVACEPYCVFQMCNQVPIIGFRLHDHLYGGDTAGEVTHGYLQAWADFNGGINPEGHFSPYVVRLSPSDDDPKLVNRSMAWADGWIGALMNTWRHDFVAENYRNTIGDWLVPSADGTISIRPGGTIADSGDRVQPGTQGEFGWIAAWASEMGDEETVTGLLRHADTYMNPRWENGGLLYPRHDDTFDADGHYAAVIPTMSNATLPYARLNVEDGLRTIYQQPWTDSERSRPALVGLSPGVDVLRAWFHDDRQLLQLHVRPVHDGPEVEARLDISPAWSHGEWTLWVDGTAVAHSAQGSVRGDDPAMAVSVVRTGDHLELALPLASGRDIEMQWTRR